MKHTVALRTGSSRRRGFTMIEMITNVAACSLLLAFSVQVLNRSFMVQRDSMEHMATMRSLQQLHDRLRRDAALATEVVVTEDGFQIQSADQRVAYRIKQEEQSIACERILERSETADAEVNLATSEISETWSLPDGVTVVCTLDQGLIRWEMRDWLSHPVIWIFAVSPSPLEVET